MAFEKGKERTGGRRKGTPNKATVELKTMIHRALDKVGGEDYLVKQANDNPTAFLGLIGKILPKDLNHGGQKDNPLISFAGALDAAYAALEKYKAHEVATGGESLV